MGKLFDLTGKVAIVTGGSRGLGKAMALGLAGAGADLVVASRTLADCDVVAEEIRELGRQACAIACDMGKLADTERLVAEAYSRFGHCDVLVNNAGASMTFRSLFETTGEFFDQVFAVNVKGILQLSQLVARRMGEAGGGSIINVTTAGILPGVHGIANLGAYCSSKAALQVLTRVMAEEWAPLAVRVNNLAPGSFRTDIFKKLDACIPGFSEFAGGQAIQKRVADPDEIVGAVLFLASGASSYVTGQTLSVCGGLA